MTNALKHQLQLMKMFSDAGLPSPDGAAACIDALSNELNENVDT